MLRKCRVCLFQGATSRFGMVSAVALFSVAIAGCSADVGRFDFASVSSPSDTARGPLTPSEPLRRNAGIPVDPETPRDGGYQRPPMGNDRTPVGGAREPAVRMSGLPEPTSREPLAPAKPASAPVLPRANATAQPATGRQVPTSSAPVTATGGQVIEVLQGDTLYGLSRKHRVAISELMTLNNLQNPTIKPGQKLTLPGGKRAVVQRAAVVPAKPAVPAAAPTKAAARPVAAAQPAPVAAPAPADWAGSYTVASGDSLFAIARKHGVKAADLQTANSIADPTKVRPGTVLKVPGTGVTPQPTADVETPPLAAKTVGAAKTASGAKPKIINAPTETAPATQVAALGSNAPTQTDASAGIPKAEPAAAGGDAGKAVAGLTGKFRWPVKGKVIAGFGPRADNTHNDGINISVPPGTDVLAAEGGTVAYAGSELKGYGNLILVRHDGNWVSAYAHNDQLLVKRGDKVKRGQSIAKAGNTGSVDQPQVHFELRQGSKPIDPVPHMEKN